MRNSLPADTVPGMAQPTDREARVETALRRVGEINDAETLHTWIDGRRPEQSWPKLADEIRRLTDLYVSERSLRSWHADHRVTPAKNGGTS